MPEGEGACGGWGRRRRRRYPRAVVVEAQVLHRRDAHHLARVAANRVAMEPDCAEPRRGARGVAPAGTVRRERPARQPQHPRLAHEVPPVDVNVHLVSTEPRHRVLERPRDVDGLRGRRSGGGGTGRRAVVVRRHQQRHVPPVGHVAEDPLAAPLVPPVACGLAAHWPAREAGGVERGGRFDVALALPVAVLRAPRRPHRLELGLVGHVLAAPLVPVVAGGRAVGRAARDAGGGVGGLAGALPLEALLALPLVGERHAPEAPAAASRRVAAGGGGAGSATFGNGRLGKVVSFAVGNKLFDWLETLCRNLLTIRRDAARSGEILAPDV